LRFPQWRHHVVWQTGIKHSEEPPASIFKAKEKGKVQIQGRADGKSCEPMGMVALTRANNIYETERGREKIMRKRGAGNIRENAIGVAGRYNSTFLFQKKNSHLFFSMLKYKYLGMTVTNQSIISTTSGSARQNMPCFLQNQRVQHLVHKSLPLIPMNPNESSPHNTNPIL
jgi:hypothetical protein